jgi:copper(I)-binding protein
VRNLSRPYQQSVQLVGISMTFAALVAICGTFPAFGQTAAPAQPGAPVAPAAPIVPTPGAPTPAPGDSAAKARAAAVAAKANIDVGEAWTRATPGNATTAAVYLKIASNKDADRLVGIEAAAAQTAEVHDDVSQNGVVKMVALPAIDIPAGGLVNFAPGGRHVMLTGLKGSLKEGESFIMTLKFDKAGTESTAVKVLGAAATGLPSLGTTRRGDTTAGVSQR